MKKKRSHDQSVEMSLRIADDYIAWAVCLFVCFVCLFFLSRFFVGNFTELTRVSSIWILGRLVCFLPGFTGFRKSYTGLSWKLAMKRCGYESRTSLAVEQSGEKER